MNNNPFPNKDKKRLLLTLLKMMGGGMVEVSFSGGGDSGSVDNARLIGADGKEIDLSGAEFEWEREVGYHDQTLGKWAIKTEVAVMPLNDILVQITEDALDATELDWYNNEGGQGMLTIDLTDDPPKIDLSVGINYTHTNDYNYDYTGDADGEET
jgi:hypothetical protein